MDALQVREKFTRCRIARLGMFCEHRDTTRDKRCGSPRRQRREGRGLIRNDCRQGRTDRSVISSAPGQHLGSSSTPNTNSFRLPRRASCCALAPATYSRRCRRRGGGDVRDRRCRLRRNWRHELAQTEVEDLELALSGDYDVARLEIPVGMMLASCACARPSAICTASVTACMKDNRPRDMVLLQRVPAYAQERDVERPVGLTKVVNGHDVLMVQSGDGAGFSLEPRTQVRIVLDGRRRNLERDVAPEFHVESLIDLAHSPGPEESGNLVAPQAIDQRAATSMCGRIMAQSD